MKLIIVVAVALLAVAVAVPTEPPKIIRSDYAAKPAGGYAFNFETDNGILRTEDGDIKEVLDEDKKPHIVVVQRGSYTYITPEGKPETVNYYADETGYHAEGDSIPKERR